MSDITAVRVVHQLYAVADRLEKNHTTDDEGAHVRNLADDVNTEIAELRAVNAELLAALQRLHDLPIDCSQTEDGAAWIQARGAMARATK